MTIPEKLQALYPTIESLQKVRKDYPSWSKMALAVGVSVDALYKHRKSLGMKMPIGNGKTDVRKEHLTDAEIRRNIREMFPDEIKNVVTTYRADLEVFLKNPCGMDGLELVKTEHGNVWGMVNNPNVRGKSK